MFRISTLVRALSSRSPCRCPDRVTGRQQTYQTQVSRVKRPWPRQRRPGRSTLCIEPDWRWSTATPYLGRCLGLLPCGAGRVSSRKTIGTDQGCCGRTDRERMGRRNLASATLRIPRYRTPALHPRIELTLEWRSRPRMLPVPAVHGGFQVLNSWLSPNCGTGQLTPTSASGEDSTTILSW
jgi:hypothetical protein